MQQYPSHDPTAAILDNREDQYGRFDVQSETAQGLKAFLGQVRRARVDVMFPPDARESMDMICTKLSRLVHGDPSHLDSWDDIAGYARLVADRIRRERDEVQLAERIRRERYEAPLDEEPSILDGEPSTELR